jgi:hypothetical protein
MLAPDVSTSFHRFPTGVAGRRSIRARLLQLPPHRALSLSLSLSLSFTVSSFLSAFCCGRRVLNGVCGCVSRSCFLRTRTAVFVSAAVLKFADYISVVGVRLFGKPVFILWFCS